MSDKTLKDLLQLNTSRAATAPYSVSDSEVPNEKMRILSQIIRSTKIDDKWKTPAKDTLTQELERKPTVIEDIIWETGESIKQAPSNIAAATAVGVAENPSAFALGAAAGTTGAVGGLKIGAALGSVAGPIGTFIGGGVGAIAGGLAGAEVAGEGLVIKAAGDAESDNPLLAYKNLKRKLEIEYAQNKVSDEEYNTKSAEYNRIINHLIDDYTKHKDTKDAIIDDLQGYEYPDKTIVDSIISWGAKTLDENREWKEWQEEQRGMSPNATAKTVGGAIGYITTLAVASKLYRDALRQPRLKTIKGVYNAKTGAEKVVETPSPYSRQQVIDKLEKFGKGYSFATTSAQYMTDDILKYIDQTGDYDLAYYAPSDLQSAMAASFGATQTVLEYGLGGIDSLIVGSFKKVGIKTPMAKAATQATLQETGEESFQELDEFLSRYTDGTNTRTWREALRDMAVAGGWGAVFGSTIGSYSFHTNRKNLIKGIKEFGQGRITDAQATQVADAMLNSMVDAFNYNNNTKLRDNLRQKIELMYRDSDIENKADRIDAITDLEYSLISMDAAERGIDLAEHELFAGEVNELGWFREGVPEARRTEIQQINDNIVELKTQLAELNKAQEKDWEKIEEVENKLAQANQYVLEKLSDLARDDANAVRRALQDLENKYVAKEKEKALDSFEATQEQKELSAGAASYVFNILSKEGFDVQTVGGQGKKRAHGSSYLVIKRPGAADLKVRIGVTPIGTKHSAVALNLNAEKLSQEEILNKIRELIDQKFVKSNKATNVNIGFDEEPMFQEEPYSGDTIVVDGVERTVYNSNGDKIADSAEALTNFWRWFGDSKVVDEQGRPLVVYHGTNVEFSEFEGDQIYFSQFSDIAGSYGIDYDPIAREGIEPILYSVYLKMENPLNIRSLSDFKKILDSINAPKDSAYRQMEKLLSPDFNFSSLDYDLQQLYSSRENMENRTWTALYLTHQQDIIKYAKENGFDGILDLEQSNQGGWSYNGFIAFEPNQIKSVDNRGIYSSDTGNIYLQNRVSGGAPATYRGAYIPTYRFILRANRMDASTLSHELAHDWMETNFARYRSGKASKDFMKAWGALEKALGIDEKATEVPRKASEAFARAYEGWIVQNEDWSKFINIDNKDKDAVEKLLKDYQSDLRDIYNDISNPYFKQTWGKLGELKPELKAWFDRVVNITDLDVLAERGEITEEQAAQEKLNRAIDTVIETTEDAETAQALKEARTLNDVERYEVEGGNKNSIQRRLANLAREIDENNMAVKGDRYDTRRDMMAVAEAADNFVKTRLDDALAIINGQMAEVEGLYKEDLYTALERLAIENGDLGLIDELKNSEVANKLAKELGQRVAGFRNFKQSTDIDVVSALKSLDIKFNKALDNKKAKQQFDSALKLLDESIAQQDKIADKELDSFLKDLECK